MGKQIPTCTCVCMNFDSLVPRPHPLREGEGLVHQVQILGSVPQNEERPIRSLKDYVITFLSILNVYFTASTVDRVMIFIVTKLAV